MNLDENLDDKIVKKEKNNLKNQAESWRLKKLPWVTSYRDPNRFSQHQARDIYALFNEISHQKNVSDIIITSDKPVMIKVKRGGLFAITHRQLEQSEATDMVKVITNDPNTMTHVSQGKTMSGLARLLEDDAVDTHNMTEAADFIRQKKNRYRYEIVGAASSENEYSFSMVLRPLPPEPISYEKLNIPKEFIESFMVKDGICIIGGATGEGKTTTLASVIRYALENDTIIKGNMITHEEPIEISYDSINSEHSYVTQSAIGQHIKTFMDANRAAMRRSPDLVLVGELRDGETVEAAVELALTGHPVFATTHANSVSAILPRLLSRFPQEVQSEKCFDILDTTRLLASQKLIWGVDGRLMAIREYLRLTPELRTYLLQFSSDPPTVIRKIAGIVEKGLFGVQSYKKQGLELLEKGLIDEHNFNHLVDKSATISEDDLEQLNKL